jgi:PAS domain S-box-containing protein
MNSSSEAAERRRCAEERLKERHRETAPARTEADTQRLIHELQVHQIELEMQNDELQQARDVMEAAMEKYSDLYDFAPVGYLTLDREGTIHEANLAAATLLGIDRSRLVQRRFGLYLSAADRPANAAFLKKVFESKGRECCEVTLLKEGKPPVEVRIEAAVAASKRECRAVVEDITEQKRAEADRLILNKLESTGILAGGIAHDFNNLLTVILLELEQARSLAPPGEELARRLEATKNTALTARGLTQQLITFAKGGAPVRKLTHLSHVVRDSVRPALSGSRVRCEFSLPDQLWRAEVDEGQIGQVIRNMVLNAREAMPQGGVVSVRAENVILKPQGNPSLPPGDYVRLSIADHGVGIARGVLSKIFDPYFSTKQRGDQKGMGLGLTICHTVIHKHGGAIAVESEVGAGATFHIHLPASRNLPPEEKASSVAIPPQAGRILVMDDEEAVRNVIGVSLQRLGHEVELVADGQKAIDVYGNARERGRPFDLVLLDLTVCAGIGGHEAMQTLLKLDPTVKAIAMSGYANDAGMLEPQRYGYKGVLAKPFALDGLRQILARVMENRPVAEP